MQRFIFSAASGALATVPMTAAMYLGKQWLPWWQRVPLPPRLISMNVLRRIGLGRFAWGDRERIVSLLAHISFGTFAGLLFRPTEGSQGSYLLKGAGYGLLVWGVSYLGALPGLGLLPMATKAPFKRNVLMLAGHLVWGASMGRLSYLQSNE